MTSSQAAGSNGIIADDSSEQSEASAETSVKKIFKEDRIEDARRRLGTEAIEQLASGLNLAANTIEGFSQNVSQLAKYYN